MAKADLGEDDMEELLGPVTSEEVKQILMHEVDPDSSPGEDGITTEMLKQLEEFGIDKLTELYNEMYSTGHIPEELLISVFITLPKKTRATKCSDFRTFDNRYHICNFHKSEDVGFRNW